MSRSAFSQTNHYMGDRAIFWNGVKILGCDRVERIYVSTGCLKSPVSERNGQTPLSRPPGIDHCLHWNCCGKMCPHGLNVSTRSTTALECSILRGVICGWFQTDHMMGQPYTIERRVNAPFVSFLGRRGDSGRVTRRKDMRRESPPRVFSRFIAPSQTTRSCIPPWYNIW